MSKLISISVIFLAYYSLLYITFINPAITGNTPILKQKLSNNLKNNANTFPKDEFHTYCYYPGGSIGYYGQGNGSVTKRVSSFDDCQGWYGILEVRETQGTSEENLLLR